MATKSADANTWACTFEVTLDRDLEARIREDAERAGLSVSEWLREAAWRHLADATERDILRQYRNEGARKLLEEFEAQNGPLTDEERKAAAAEWPD